MKFPYNRVLEIQARYQAGKLDREAAKEELAYLLDLKNDSDFCAEAAGEPTEYYKPESHGPLLRLSDVCNTLRLFAKVFCEPLPTDDEWKKKEREEHREHFYKVDLAISKSCLLDRLFFQENERVRTEPCPEHNGHWSGCNWNSPGCACRNGANVTGWLPLPEAEGYVDAPEAPLCDFCGKPPTKQGLWSHRVDNKHGHPECMDKNPLVRAKP